MSGLEKSRGPKIRKSRSRRGRPSEGMPAIKLKDFKGTLKRLLVYLRPFKFQIFVVFLMVILATATSIASPKILGLAITRLYDGAMMKLKGIQGAKIDFSYISKIQSYLCVYNYFP